MLTERRHKCEMCRPSLQDASSAIRCDDSVMAQLLSPRGFDVRALFAALDRKRASEGHTWTVAAELMWDESAILNARRGDHTINTSTITNICRSGDVSCQHSLVMLRWLGRPPEDFVARPRIGTRGVALPAADRAHRIRWDLQALYDALDKARTERGATWAQAATRLQCPPSQLTGLCTARYSTSMRLAMRITQALARPAADFIYPTDW
jgi:hypothetical protein